MSKIVGFHYPTYDELPSDLIFLDELVQMVNTVHGPLPTCARNGHDAFTRSMAANYIKQHLTAPAVGKKYNREHVSRILFAATAKLVLQASDTLALTHALYGEKPCQEAHDHIAAAMNNAFAGTLTIHEESSPSDSIAFAVAAKTFALLALN